MANEYKLSYTASQIDEKLGKVDKLVASVNGVKPDANGNVNINTSGGGGSAIIDVTELPTENIREDAFYRLMTADFVCYGEKVTNGSIIHCVNGLPQTGDVVTDFEMVRFNGYYNLSDGVLYGYVDSTLGGAFGVPAGWYPFEALAQVAGLGFNGIFTDINDVPSDNSYFGVLLSKDFYIYQDGWCKVPFAYEKVPEFDITWDGNMDGKFALDMSLLGVPNIYFVKISDAVFTMKQILGATYTQINGYEKMIDESCVDASTYPGIIDIDGGIVICYSSDDANAAFGLPAGYLTNGVYFVYNTDFFSDGRANYTNHFVASSKITKIDSKYLDIDMDIDLSGLANVARTGNYSDLLNKPAALLYDARYSLSSQYQKNVRDTINVYSKSEVDTKIANAEGNVIDLTAYAKKTDLTAYAKTSDLTAYAKTSDVESLIANSIGAAIGGSY